MKTTVVCGLLGAGKTTFIRNFLRGKTERTVVLVNDFGAAGIDGEIFSAGGIESIELPSGCVCCTLKFDLITTITRIIKEFSPEHLVIEPSGVASPSGVLEALESAGVGPVSVVGVVDATEFTELYESGTYGGFFGDQIVNSDVILLNKTDLATEAKIIEARNRIGLINPRAVLFRTKNAVVRDPLPDVPRTRKVRATNSHFHFDTVSFRFKPGVELESFKSLFVDLAQGAYGTVVRAKALVRTDQGPHRFDLVFGKIDCAIFETDVEDSRMVVIGEALDREAIRSAIS
jgi:G3E family GTPase